MRVGYIMYEIWRRFIRPTSSLSSLTTLTNYSCLAPFFSLSFSLLRAHNNLQELCVHASLNLSYTQLCGFSRLKHSLALLFSTTTSSTSLYVSDIRDSYKRTGLCCGWNACASSSICLMPLRSDRTGIAFLIIPICLMIFFLFSFEWLSVDSARHVDYVNGWIIRLNASVLKTVLMFCIWISYTRSWLLTIL